MNGLGKTVLIVALILIGVGLLAVGLCAVYASHQ